MTIYLSNMKQQKTKKHHQHQSLGATNNKKRIYNRIKINKLNNKQTVRWQICLHFQWKLITILNPVMA